MTDEKTADDTKAENAENPVKRDLAEGKNTPHPKEIGGPAGAEPTRFGDWEKGGRCSDF